MCFFPCRGMHFELFLSFEHRQWRILFFSMPENIYLGMCHQCQLKNTTLHSVLSPYFWKCDAQWAVQICILQMMLHSGSWNSFALTFSFTISAIFSAFFHTKRDFLAEHWFCLLTSYSNEDFWGFYHFSKNLCFPVHVWTCLQWFLTLMTCEEFCLWLNFVALTQWSKKRG